MIGVLPPTFQWGTDTDLLSPLAPDPARNRADHRLSVIGRLADGYSIEQATTELETITSQLAQQYPESNKGWGVRVLSFYDWLIPDTTRRSLLVLLGAVGLVLLIACGNVVNLLLARGASRQKELSIRAAMGASRSRVARQLLFESALIAIVAAALGIGLAFAAMQLLIALGPASVPRLDELSIDLRVVAVRHRRGAVDDGAVRIGAGDSVDASRSAAGAACRFARRHIRRGPAAPAFSADHRGSGAVGRAADRRGLADSQLRAIAAGGARVLELRM